MLFVSAGADNEVVASLILSYATVTTLGSAVDD